MQSKKAATLLYNRMENSIFIDPKEAWEDICKECALIAIAFAKENPLNTDGYKKYLDEVEQEIKSMYI